MAGYSQSPSAWFLYRKQWAGVEGAPETQVFTMDTRLQEEPVGLGFTFFNDVTNIIGKTSGTITGSYQVALAPNQTLRFGMSFVALQNRIFFDRVQADDISDPNLLTTVDQRTVFEAGAGLHYKINKLRIGFSSDQLFQNTVRYRNEALFKSLDYTFIRHYYTSADYTFKAGKNFEITPIVLIRTVQGLPSQVDVSTLLNYKQLLWLNLMYRPSIGAGASLGMTLADQFSFGYSYEFPTSDISILGGITHEFVLGLKLGRGGSQQATTAKNGNIKSLEQQTALQHEKIDALKQENEVVSSQLSQTQSQLREQNEELRLLREIVSGYEADLTRAIAQLQASPQDTLSSDGGPYYLVVGALRTVENAKLFQRILKREAGLDTRVIQNAGATWYFVYTEEMSSLRDAIDKVGTLRNSKAQPFIIGNPWVYKLEKR